MFSKLVSALSLASLVIPLTSSLPSSNLIQELKDSSLTEASLDPSFVASSPSSGKEGKGIFSECKWVDGIPQEVPSGSYVTQRLYSEPACKGECWMQYIPLGECFKDESQPFHDLKYKCDDTGRLVTETYSGDFSSSTLPKCSQESYSGDRLVSSFCQKPNAFGDIFYRQLEWSC